MQTEKPPNNSHKKIYDNYNRGQNTWNKVKKSSKIGQEYEI